MKIRHIFLLLMLSIPFSLLAQQVEKAEYGTFLLQNAEIHTVSNGIINGSVLIENGKISQIGDITDAPENANVIDCAGKRIYPGFIDAGTRLGLSEVGAVSVTNDYNEIGDFTPHMKALTAVNPNSVSIPVSRTNGVTTVITKPSGGTFPGTAALIDLHGYTPDQMYAGVEMVYMQYPSSGKRGWWDRRSDEEIEKEAKKAQKKIDEIFEKAKVYARIDSSRQSKNLATDRYNPQMDALLTTIRAEQAIMIEVSKKADILKAIKMVKKYKLNAIFSGVADGWRVSDSLVAANIPVIVGPVLSNPSRSSDKYDRPYSNPALMQKAGVKVAIRSNNSENVRNLPFEAGFAAAYGMGTEEALKAITIYPAEILGVADHYGSIEKDKVANLFICDGDPFEMKTRISHLFIKGWRIPIENRHTLLNEEFLKRSPGLEK